MSGSESGLVSGRLNRSVTQRRGLPVGEHRRLFSELLKPRFSMQDRPVFSDSVFDMNRKAVRVSDKTNASLIIFLDLLRIKRSSCGRFSINYISGVTNISLALTSKSSLSEQFQHYLRNCPVGILDLNLSQVIAIGM